VLLRESLPALLGQDRPFRRVIVVDNASPDTREFLAGRPGTERIALATNLGFAAGANRGIARALEDPEVAAVAVINDDVVLERGWSRAAFEALERDPRHGACATCVLRASDGRVDSAGIEWRAPGLADNAGHGADAPPPDGPLRRVAGASAAAALYRRAMLDDVGAFDEWLFAYQEDVDLALRAAARGWSAVFAPGARATHRGHASNRPFAFGGTRADFWNARNRLLVAVKSLPRAEWRRHFGSILAAQLGLVVRSFRERRLAAVACGAALGVSGVPRALASRLRA
jgi:GT2 family glycosyltransferase